MYEIKKLGNDKPVAARVEDALMEYILKQPIGIGERLPNEFDLSQMFGVGRSTIREAVKSLESKKVLEVRRGSGTYVVSTTKMEDDPLGFGKFEDPYTLAKELLEVRLMLEPEIAAMAAEHASDEEKQEIRHLCDMAEASYESAQERIRYDMEFHSYIAHCSKNRVVETILPIIVSAVSTFGNITQTSLKQETITTHRMIAQAIEASDPDGARYAMITHLNYNRNKIRELEQIHRSK